MIRIVFLALAILVAVLVPIVGAASTGTRPAADLRKEYQKGNYKDAYDGISPLVISPAGTNDLEADFQLCVSCLRNLGRVDEVDDFREKAIAAHGNDWRFLWEAARSYRDVDHYGRTVAGKFYRGNQHSIDGKWVVSYDRDRVRALQLMRSAMGLITGKRGEKEAQFYNELAGVLLQGDQGEDAWRLQTLTDLQTLPDVDERSPYYYAGWRGNSRGAPVDDEGRPVFHVVPKSWEAATTDGQRWRWALHEASSFSDAMAAQVQFEFASFLYQQFGVQTMAEYGGIFRGNDTDDGKKSEGGPYAVYTLKDDETIAKLANGIKRFQMPDEFNPIIILKTVAAQPAKGDGSYPDRAMQLLAQIYSDRQQYDTAADWWRKGIARFGPGYDHQREKALAQIVGNWATFENLLVQPSSGPKGAGAKVDLRFRNGSKVHFSAREVDVEKLIGDVKAYLKTKPNELNSDNVELSNIGWRLIEKKQEQYIGKEIAAWDLALEPRANHFDKRVTVQTPLAKAGAYLLEGTMDGGNISRIIVWVSDTVIVRKELKDSVYTYIADAVTGQPVPKVTVSFFGYRQQWLQDRRYRMDIQEFSEIGDTDGQVIVPRSNDYSNDAPPPIDSGSPLIRPGFNWVTTATGVDGDGNKRLAFLGFNGIWNQGYYDAYDSQYNQTKAYVVTDRPVYRPGDKVQWKMWVGHNRYDEEGANPFVGQQVSVQITSPKGEIIKTITGTVDEWGGISGEYVTEKEATLGTYGIHSPQGWGGISFRVEEYKKPEYEVKIAAPTEPIALGEKVTATISAKYYFGSPVVNAKVKYKITRTSYDARWYPAAAWDWFYEPGYWWFASDYLWYPGWERWGCMRPMHAWWPGLWSNQQPEIVSENEVAIGADGTVKVEIDTSVAKAAYGDQDHKYEISAEVTDASRRTIVGTGQVLVARQPFKVYAWVDRGYYNVGDTVAAHFTAQTLDNKPVSGAGDLKLFSVSYDDQAKPVEKLVQEWELNPKEDGTQDVQVHAQAAGQYRLSYTVKDAKGRSIEGGYVFVVRGKEFDGTSFRFNDIEVVTDKKEYAAGDKVRLMVNTNRADATVLLFIRPTNGVYLAPEVIRLSGKSVVREVEVGNKDMPNFFIEGLTVANAKVYTDVREVIVPPEDRILNVSVSADAAEYKPGQKATLKVKVTEKNGEPFNGSAVMALYDKSVEYISGGSNAADIRKYFWQWRRQHTVIGENSAGLGSENIVRSGEIGMGYLGVFGAMATEFGLRDRLEGISESGAIDTLSLRKGGVGGGGVFGGRPMAMSMAAPAPMGAAFAEDRTKDDSKKTPDVIGDSTPQDEATVRSNFADTAFWAPSLVTAKNGTATVEVTMPESLTTWKAKVWALGAGTRVGEGETEIVTSKKLIVRLEAPRFFVQNDEVVLSAIVHNYLKTKKHVRVELKLSHDLFSGVNSAPIPSISSDSHLIWTTQSVDVDANGEARVDWRMKVRDEGKATIIAAASTDEESDAMQLSFPVYIHGMLKTDSFSGVVGNDAASASVTVQVPRERRPEQSVLEIRYSPTLAGAMVDALPYLVDYPYGCTEQTLNRFVPTVVTQKILLDMHLDLAAIQKKRTNLNAQEIGNDVERAKRWQRADHNPVFDQEEVNRMVREGVTRLSNMQLSDGGWGWFSGTGEQSYPHTTAVVVHGLQLGRDNGAAVDASVLERGVHWLVNYQKQRIAWVMKERKERTVDDVDAFIYMVLVDADHDNTEMRKLLFEDRTGLAVYTKAMFGLALSKVKDVEKLNTILDNCRQYVVQDNEDQTAYLKMPESGWWYWYDSEFEANAYYLKLLARTDPKGETTSRLAKYLINNRRNGSYWNSTRDTADCIEALADYLRASGETVPDMTVNIALDGKELKSVKITADNLFAFDNKVVLAGSDVPDGTHTVQVSRTGSGRVYFNAYLTNFTLENAIKRAGLEVKVNRKIYLLTESDKRIKAEGSHGQAVDQRVEKYVRTELADGGTVKSGDLVEVELEVDSKNDYEYIVLEDMKAAGFEPVEVQSGYNGNDMGAYVEFHDERVAFFVRWLARGKHSVSYRLRAEVPGSFSALPTKASAMYAPELKGNSDEIKLNVEDVPSVIGGAKSAVGN